MSEFDNITGGIGELDGFVRIGFVLVLEVDDITGRIGELDFVDNIGFVLVWEVHNITGGIREVDLEHRHPWETELKTGSRGVEFSLELPHPSAKRMTWTILHPIFEL